MRPTFLVNTLIFEPSWAGGEASVSKVKISKTFIWPESIQHNYLTTNNPRLPGLSGYTLGPAWEYQFWSDAYQVEPVRSNRSQGTIDPYKTRLKKWRGFYESSVFFLFRRFEASAMAMGSRRSLCFFLFLALFAPAFSDLIITKADRRVCFDPPLLLSHCFFLLDFGVSSPWTLFFYDIYFILENMEIWVLAHLNFGVGVFLLFGVVFCGNDPIFWMIWIGFCNFWTPIWCNPCI